MTLRQELNEWISQNFFFYNQTKLKFSIGFLEFLYEYASSFTQETDFQYIIVPNDCHDEFKSYLKNPNEQSVYNDARHHHYIDPHITPYLYKFCQIHQIIGMCQKIQNHPIHRLLPTSFVIEEFKKQCIPPDIFSILLECLEPSGLVFLLPSTHTQNAVRIAHLLLQNSQKFPLYINNVFITNWLVQQGCPLSMVKTMWDKGFPIKFPFKIEDHSQKLCSVSGEIVQFILEKSNQYPFNLTIDQIINCSSYKDQDHFPIVYYCLKKGYSPSNTGFSILLKKTDLNDKDFYFLDYATQKLKNDEFDIDIWADIGWQENQDIFIQLIMTFCKQETQTYLLIHLCMNMMDILYIDMDYWVLWFFKSSFSRYLQFVHLVRFCKRGSNEVLYVDPRILEYIRQPTLKSNPQTILYPPLYEKQPQTIIFYDQDFNKVEIPVYFSFLRSGLLSRLVHPNGFKPSSNPDNNIIELMLGLPNIFRDQKKIMCDWVLVSYLKTIPTYFSIEDTIELYNLSQYLIDEECEKTCKQHLERHFMEEFEVHMKQHHNKKQECLLCSFWYHKSF